MKTKADLFVDSRCELGEGPFWHPLLERLFWFDILNQTMLSATPDGHIVDRVTFPDRASAAAVIDRDNLAVAVSGMLTRYNLVTDERAPIFPIEADKPHNRTNDSRVDPSGGFWIGTMGRKAEKASGSVQQYRAGKMTPIMSDITIPNAICFSPDGRFAYHTDAGAEIKRCRIDPETGLPISEWETFSALKGVGGADGAVVDTEGYVWNARWGAGVVIRFSPDGEVDTVVDLPVSQPSCPAFGGKDGKTLYITTAREHMSAEQLEREPLSGSVFVVELDVPGRPDPFIKL